MRVHTRSRTCAILVGAFLALLSPIHQQAHAYIANGARAIDEIGQYNGSLTDPQPVYTKGTGFIGDDAPNALGGYTSPYGVEIDRRNHRLYVSDQSYYRVLVYNLDANNLLIDRLPDAVLGQPDFGSRTPTASQRGLYTPAGMAFASGSNLLFVADTSANRVIVYDVASITSYEPAVYVLGQSRFTAINSGVGPDKMSAPADVAYDASGNRLFVADRANNRVLVFDVSTIVNGEAAVNVLGQSTFIGSSCPAAGQGTLCNPYGVEFDPTGNRLFVSDYSNNRILVFDVASITDGENAASVLGQTTFSGGGCSISQSSTCASYSTAFDDAGDRLFVMQNSHNRITVFDVASISNGENAVNVLGQPDYTTSTSSTKINTIPGPYASAYDSSNQYLYAASDSANRVEIFDVVSITNNESMTDLLGQYDDNLSAPSPRYNKSGANSGPNKLGFNFQTNISVDSTNNRLFVSDSNIRLLGFNLNSDGTLVDHIPDLVIGQPDFATGSSVTSQSGFANVRGTSFDPSLNRLYVADSTNNRVLVFSGSLTNGMNAWRVLGQSSFTTSSSATTQSGMWNPQDVAASGSRLFVDDYTNNRVLVFDVADITNGENAANVLGQATFTTRNTATTAAGMSSPSGLSYDTVNKRLFVADTSNNRVTVYDMTTISDGESAVNVLGQSLFTTSSNATTRTGMYNPSEVDFDEVGNRLFVADAINGRIMVYDTASITDGEAATHVLGKRNFTEGTGIDVLREQIYYYTYGVAHDDAHKRLHASDYYASRVLTFDTSAASNTTIRGTAYDTDGATGLASKVVTMAVNGTTAGSGSTTSTGAYAITIPVYDSGSIVTAYLDNNTEKGATTTRGPGAGFNNFDIRRNSLIVRSHTGAWNYSEVRYIDDNADTDLTQEIINAGTFNNFMIKGRTLRVASGAFFQPYTLTTVDTIVNGTLNPYSTFTNTGALTVSSGALVLNSGTTSVTGTASFLKSTFVPAAATAQFYGGLALSGSTIQGGEGTVRVGPQPGLLDTYYDGTAFNTLYGTLVDPAVKFSPDDSATLGTARTGASTTYSHRWTGQVKANYAETYTFYVTTDDGSRLYIDGTLVVDSWFDQGETERSGSIALSKGWHTIQLEHYNNAGPGAVSLLYSSSSEAKKVIPTTNLRTCGATFCKQTTDFIHYVQTGGLVKDFGGTLQVMGSGDFLLTRGKFAASGGTLRLKGNLVTKRSSFTHSGTVLLEPNSANRFLQTGTGIITNLQMNDGLVGYWKFDERNGYTTTAIDASGNNNNGSYLGTPVISSDIAPTGFPNSGSLLLDGTDDYVQVTDSAVTDDRGLRSNNVTIALWIKKVAHTNYGTYVSKNLGNTNTSTSWWQLLNYSTTGRFAFRATEDEDSLISSAGSAVGTNTWTHVAVTYNGTIAKIYINGKLDNSTALSAVFPSQYTTQMYIGRRSDGYYANSYIDDLRFYNRALTDAEIASLAGGTAIGSGTGTTTLSGSLNVRGNVLFHTGTLNASGSSISASGTWINEGGRFTSRTGLVTLRGTGSRVIRGGGQTFNTLLLSGGTIRYTEPLTVSGVLTVRGGTILQSSGAAVLRTGSVRQLGGQILTHSGTILLTSQSTGSLALSNTGYNLRVEDSTERDLVGYWKFDEGQRRAEDWSGRLNHGEIREGAVWTGGLLPSLQFNNRKGLLFDGTDDWVEVASPDMPTGDFTFSTWVYLASTSDEAVAAIRDSGAASDEFLLYVSTTLNTYTNNTLRATSSTSLSTGTWTHLAVTRNGNTITQYINGAVDGTGTDGTIFSPGTCSFMLGTESDSSCTASLGNYFSGAMDDVRLYNRALRPWEVRNLSLGRYARGSSGTSVTTLTTPLNLSGSLSIDAGRLATNGNDVSVKNGFNITGGSFSGSTANLTVNGNVFLSTGATLIAPTGWFRVKGSWENESGSLMPRTGTVTLIGTAQYLSGSTTFYNLKKTVTSSDTLQFEARSTQAISGTLTLSGSSTSSRLLLRSSSTGVRWFINPSGTRNVSYLDVKDSKNTNASTINCLDNCMNSGNNNGWNFGTVVAIFGTVFNDAGITNIGANKTVAISVNGNTPDATAETTSTGAYSLTGLTHGPDDVITLYLDGETEKAVTLTVGKATNTTGADLWRDYVIVRCDNTCDATSTTLKMGDDNGDTDITGLYSTSGNILTMYKVVVPKGQTLRPTDRMNVTDDVIVRGTLKMPNKPFVVGGDFTMSGGRISASGTLVMKGAVSKYLETEGQRLNNVVLTNGLVSYWPFDEVSGSAASDMSGFSHSGTYTGGVGLAPSPSTTVAPVRFANARSLDFNGSTGYLNVANPDSPAGDFTYATWVRPDTNSDEMIAMQSDGSGGDEFYWYINGSSKITTTTNNTLRATSTANIPTNTWTHLAVTRSGSSITQYVNGLVDGTGTDGTAMSFSTCQFLIGVDVDSGCIGSLGNYYDGKIDDFRVYDYALTATDIAGLAAGNHPATGSGVTTLSGSLAVKGDILLNAGTLDVSASDYPITVTGSWLNQGGKFAPRHGTVTLDGNASAKRLMSGGQRFHNLTMNADGAPGGTWSLGDRLNVSGSLVLTNGTLDASSSGSFTLRTKVFSSNGGTFTKRFGTMILSNDADVTTSLPSRVHRLRIEDPTEWGLVGYWKFDEGQQSVQDWSGRENHGTLLNGPLWTGAILPGITFDNPHALRLDGTDDYVSLSGTPVPQTIGTIAAWVRPNWNASDSVTNKFILNGQAGTQIAVWYDNSKRWTFYYGSSLASSPVQTFSAGTWQHIAMTYNTVAGEYAVFINGAVSGTGSGPISPTQPSSILLGTFAPGNGNINASLDDIRVYNRVLTGNEIKNLANGRYASMTASGASSVKLGALLSASGSFALDSGTFNADKKGVIVHGSGSVFAGTYKASTAVNVFSGGLVSAGVFVGSSALIDVNAGVTILTGTFIAPRNANMTVYGNWLKQNGHFMNNSGTVVLDGPDQTISGSTIFGNFRKTVSTQRTLTFAAGTTQTFTGSMMLQGAAGQRLFLRSSSTGTRAKIDPRSSRSVQYLNVQDNENINASSISCLTSCVDNGNNINWNFGTAITGRFYTNEGVTAYASQPVALSINGAAASATDTTDSNGSFSLAVSNYSAGSVLTVYGDTGGDGKGVTITIGTGGSLSGVDLYVNRVILRNDSGSYPLTNTHINTSDNNGDTDITTLYKGYSTGAVVNNGYELLVWPNKTFTPGSPVKTDGLDIRGTMNMSGYLVRVGSAFDVKSGGTFTTTGTVLLTTDGTFNGSPYIAPRSNSFNNLAMTDGLVGYWKLDGLTGSTVIPDSSGFGVRGTLSGGGIWRQGDLHPTRYRNISALEFDNSNDTIRLTGSGIRLVRPYSFAMWWKGVGNSGQYRDLISPSQDYGPHIDTTNRLTWYDAGDNDATTVLQLGRWYHLVTTIDVSGNLTHYVNGVSDGTHVGEGSQVKYWNRIGYFNEPTASILDDVRVYSRALSAVEVAALAAGGAPATANATVSLSGAVAVRGDFTLGGGSLDVSSSNYSMTVSGSWLNHGGRVVSRSGTIMLDGSGHLLTGGISAGKLHNLTIESTGAGKRTLDDRAAGSGILVFNAGTLDMGSGSSLRFDGIRQTGGSFVSRSGSVILSGDFSAPLTLTGTLHNLFLEDDAQDDVVAHYTFDDGQVQAYDRSGHNYHATINGPVWSGSVAPRIAFENLSSMQFDGTDDYVVTPNLRNSFSDESLTISVWFFPTNGGVIISEMGSTTPNTSWHDSIIEVLSNGTTYVRVYNLTSINVGTATMNAWNHVVLRYSDSNDIVDGFLNGNQSTLINGDRSSPWDSGYGLYYGIGPIDSTNLGDGTYFNGMIDDVQIFSRALTNAEVQQLYKGRFGVGGSGAVTWRMGGALDVNGDLRIMGGKLDASAAGCAGASCNISVRGNWLNSAGSGAFIPRSGTVTLDGTDVQTLTGSTTFAGLTKSTASGTLFVDPSSLLTVTGSLTLQGSTNRLLRLRNASSSGASYPLAEVRFGPPGSSASDYNMGYRFTPKTNGVITHLGARCTAASRTARLYSCTDATCTTGTELTSATVYPGSVKDWGYTRISPVAVTAGSSYVVAVRGNPWCFKNITMPIDAGGVTIEDSRYIAASNNMPNSTTTSTMYGQADVKFVGLRHQWALVDGGSQTIDHVDVKDSDASQGSSLQCSSSAEGCVNAGNNTNWLFGDRVIAGRAFTPNGVTPLSNKRVSVSINGGAADGSAFTDSAGAYSINGSSAFSGGSVLALYLDNEAEDGITVILGSGSNMTGVHIYQSTLIARSASGTVPAPILNQHFAIADNNGDGDVTSYLSMTNYNILADYNMRVWTGTTLWLSSGSLTTGNDLHMDGSLRTNGYAVSVSNTYSQSGGTFYGGTGAVTIYGEYRQDGGTFIAPGPNRTLLLGDDIRHQGGRFVANSGTVLLNSSNGAMLQGSGMTFNHLTVNTQNYGAYVFLPFDELAGTRAQDISGYSNSGNLVGGAFTNRAAPLQSDNRGSATFDGNDYILVSDSSTTDPFYLTISVWIRVTAGNGTYRHIVCKPSGSTWSAPYAYYCLRLNSSNQVEAWFNTPSGSNLLTSQTTISADSKWHHLAYTMVAGSQALYIDGQSVATNTVNSSVTGSSEPLVIGARNSKDLAEYFTGDIDDLRIYLYNLSASEVRALASGGNPVGTYATTASGSRVNVGGDMTIHTPLTVSSSSPEFALAVSGSWINTGGTFTSRSGSVIFDGSGGIQTGGPYGAFNNVIIEGSGNGKRVLRDRMMMSGSLVIQNGTLNAGNRRGILARRVVQTGGTFQHGSGTITLTDYRGSTGSILTGPAYNVHIEDPTESKLEAYWKFDEGQGVGLDSSGNQRVATLTNGAQWSGSTVAPVGYENLYSAKFDGTNDYASVADFGSFTRVTVSAWIYRTGATAARESILSYKESSCGFLLNLNENGSSQYPTWYVNNGSWNALTQSVAVSTNTWTHLAGTFDGSTQKLYRDGNLVAEQSLSGNISQCSAAIGIGSRNSLDQHWFPGHIDDLRVYSRALSAQEIKALASGNYPLGWSGSTTMTLGNGPFNVSGSLVLDAGQLNTRSGSLALTQRLVLDQSRGRYIGGSARQTLNGGLSVSGALLTLNGGTLDVNGITNFSGATVRRTTGNMNLSKNVRIGKGTTISHSVGTGSIVLDGDLTLENETGLQNLGVLQIGTSPDTTTLSGNILVEQLTVGTGDMLVTNGYNMNIGTGGVFLFGELDPRPAGGRSTTIVASGSWIASGAGDMRYGSGTVIFVGTNTSHRLSSSGAFNRLIMDNGLVGYWKLDDGNGATAKNSARFGTGGTLVSMGTGTGWWMHSNNTRMRFFNRSSLEFDGVNDYVAVPNTPELNTAMFTVAAWTKRDVASIAHTIYDAGGGTWRVGFPTGNTLRISYGVSGTADSSGTVSDTNWHHVAATYNGSTIRFYIDGAPSGTAAAAISTPAAGKFIGRTRSNTEFFNGRIDDLRLYNRVLNASEILQLYNGYPSTGSGVYTMGSPLSVSGSFINSTHELDVSAQNYSLTLTGSWLNTGTFTARSGTVYLQSKGPQTLSGNTIFSTLTARTNGSNRTIFFDHSSRQSASGSLVLQGVGGSTLSLKSTRNGSGARLMLDGDAGGQTLDHLNVKDNYAMSGATLNCYTISEGCTDGGNTINWNFTDPVSTGPRKDTFMFIEF